MKNNKHQFTQIVLKCREFIHKQGQIQQLMVFNYQTLLTASVRILKIAQGLVFFVFNQFKQDFHCLLPLRGIRHPVNYMVIFSSSGLKWLD